VGSVRVSIKSSFSWFPFFWFLVNQNTPQDEAIGKRCAAIFSSILKYNRGNPAKADNKKQEKGVCFYFIQPLLMVIFVFLLLQFICKSIVILIHPSEFAFVLTNKFGLIFTVACLHCSNFVWKRKGLQRNKHTATQAKFRFFYGIFIVLFFFFVFNLIWTFAFSFRICTSNVKNTPSAHRSKIRELLRAVDAQAMQKGKKQGKQLLMGLYHLEGGL
jgi:hypothetical protein